jgi:hypothetical protein
MDAMMECMNAILGCSGGRTSKQNKVNVPPATTANRGGEEEAKNGSARRSFAPTATCLCSTNLTDATSWAPTRTTSG